MNNSIIMQLFISDEVVTFLVKILFIVMTVSLSVTIPAIDADGFALKMGSFDSFLSI